MWRTRADRPLPRDPPAPRRPLVEPLEPRRLFSTVAVLAPADDAGPLPPGPSVGETDGVGPQLLGVRVRGGPFFAEAIELTFSEPLDPARARDVDNYAVSGRFVECDCDCYDDDFCDGDFREELPIRRAEYDDAARTVTLVPEFEFLVGRSMRVVRVRGGEAGVKDVAGNRLDGNNDGLPGGKAVARFKARYGRQVGYLDADGDKVRLKLAGGGRVFVLQQLNPNSNAQLGTATQVWLTDRVTPRSRLSGAAAPTRRGGDGRAAIGELLWTHPARIDLLASPAFIVGRVEP